MRTAVSQVTIVIYILGITLAGTKKRPFARTAVHVYRLQTGQRPANGKVLNMNRAALHAVRRFHQRLAQRGVGMHVTGNLFGRQFGIVRQRQLRQ